MSGSARAPVASGEASGSDRDRTENDRSSRLPSSLRWLAVGSFAFGTEAFVIAGVLPEIGRDLEVSSATTGLLVAVFALAYGLSAPFVGAVVVRWRPRSVLRGAAALFVVANVAAALAPSFAALLAARMVAGVFAAAFTPTASVTAAGIARPDQRGRALAMVFTGMSLAMVAGVPLGTVLSDVGSWRATFVFVAVLGVIATIGIHRFVPDVERSTPATPRRAATVLRMTGVRRCLAVSVVVRAGDFAVFTYLADIVTELFGNARVSVPVALLVNGTVGWFGTTVAGRLSDRRGALHTRDLTILGSSFGLALLAIGSLFDGPVAVLVAVPAMVVWSSAAWGFGPPQQSRLLELAPEAPTAAMAANASATQIGIGLGGLVGAVTVAIATAPVIPAVGMALVLSALAVANPRVADASVPGPRRGRAGGHDTDAPPPITNRKGLR